MRRFVEALGLGVLAVALAAPPARAGTRIYVRIGPPAPIVETRVVAPGPHHVWIAGYHRWDGHAYVWVRGRWAVPPRHYVTWVPGHWVHARRGWYWADGRWHR
jgi:hypothetical protein